MKVGIVIQTYNKEKEKNVEIALNELKKTLENLYDYQVVVVDDSSDNNIAKITKEHGANIIKFNRRIGKGTAVITGIREILKYGVDYVVVNDVDDECLMKYVPKFIEALEKGADATFAYSSKPKHIFSRFMNAITGCDYNWSVGLKAFKRELAEDLAKAKPWNYIKWNYDVYSTLLPYIKDKKVEKIEIECGKRINGKSKFSGREYEYILSLPVVLKAARYGTKNLIQDYVGITFNFDEWYKRNKNLAREEIIKKIDRAEKVSQVLGGIGLTAPAAIAYFYNLPQGDKGMHMVKGYLTSGAISFLYRLKGKNKRLGKLFGLLAAIFGGIAWEYKDYITKKGVADPLDAIGDSIGGSLPSLITYLYERKIEKVNYFFF
jgi:glycosyltransferase involved in cell wall biosynthesis